MKEDEKTSHASYKERVNELLDEVDAEIVGIVTTQYDNDDEISSITIKLAPSDSNGRQVGCAQ